jgi:arylsulfatase A-like enzyme
MPESEELGGSRNDALVQPPDLMPTYLDAAGAQIPEVVQGKSLLPLIRGDKKKIRESAISSGSLLSTHFITLTEEGKCFIAMKEGFKADDAEMTVAFDFVQQGLYSKKIVVPTSEGFYDLKSDPAQNSNLREVRKEESEQMRVRMIGILESLGASDEVLKGWKKH